MAAEVKDFPNIDRNKVLTEAKTLLELPPHIAATPTVESPATTVKAFPTIIIGPWTPLAKEIALQGKWREAGDRFVADSIEHRNYTPQGILNKVAAEIIERKHMLTDGTIRALKLFWETEARAGDYTRAGLEVVRGGDPEAVVLRWGGEESRHKRLLMEALVLSGAVNPLERLEMEQRALDIKWDPNSHPGLYSEYGYLTFARRQEKDTGGNYKLLRALVRGDYGLPMKRTPFEVARGYEIGISGVLQPISRDEFAHGAMYDDLTAWLLMYKPEKAADAIQQVDGGYKMPFVDLLGDESIFVANLLFPEGEMANARAQRRSLVQANRAIGLNHRKSIERVSSQLVELESHLQTPGIATLRPNGDIIPVEFNYDLSLSAAGVYE